MHLGHLGGSKSSELSFLDLLFVLSETMTDSDGAHNGHGIEILKKPEWKWYHGSNIWKY